MYLSYYKLREEPFRLTPDPKFLHLAEPHRDALTVLIRGVLHRKGFLLLSGPVGTGKTTLLHVLLQILTERFFPDNRLRSAFVLNPRLSPTEFLETILDEFEIPCESVSKPRRLRLLHQAFIEGRSRGGTAILIVDEAHLLPAELLEEIRLLSNMDTYREKPLQIVLSGQLELLEILRRPESQALDQRIAARCHLRPLSLPETRAYVMERLHAAGLHQPSPFNGSSLEEIFRYTQGVPRLINLLCDGCLTLGMSSDQKQITANVVQEAALALELVGIPTILSTQKDAPSAPTVQTEASKSAADVLVQTIREARANLRVER